MWLCHFRYCLLNRKLKSRSKHYNKRIPSTLHGRPHAFVKHVWRRLEASKNLQSHNYLVTQGENPSCICMDFRRHSYPCKHIISGWFHDGELIIPSTANDPWWNADGYVVEHRVSKKGNPKNQNSNNEISETDSWETSQTHKGEQKNPRSAGPYKNPNLSKYRYSDCSCNCSFVRGHQ